MGIFDCFSKAVDSLNEQGCSPSETVENFKKEYDRHADKAERLFREQEQREPRQPHAEKEKAE